MANNNKKTGTKKVDLSKKNDDHDEESQGFVEKQINGENKQKIDLLGSQVSAIKNITRGLTTQIKDDKAVIERLDTGFDKTKLLISKTMGKMDDMISKGSNSMCCYVILFTIMLLAILYKFS